MQGMVAVTAALAEVRLVGFPEAVVLVDMLEMVVLEM
jgi:hypothetical protein